MISMSSIELNFAETENHAHINHSRWFSVLSTSRLLTAALSLTLALSSIAEVGVGSGAKRFAQLEQLLPTPNVYRTASGTPGTAYWQQQADYVIQATLDEKKREIKGTQKVTYSNNSPDNLSYLWLQLDQNRFKRDSIYQLSKTTSNTRDRLSFSNLRAAHGVTDTDYGHNITRLVDTKGNDLKHTVVGTMMRIDLPRPLTSGKKITFELDWTYKIVDQAAVGGRAGYSTVEKGDADIFFLAQWHP
ncbi:MAG: hypothetical protein ACI8W1_003329, partial [Candidatus Azotimanducaceae bacterium]